jgi:exodeoxyribonuclease VIII
MSAVPALQFHEALPRWCPGSPPEPISIEAYHALPGISKTGLDVVNRSPAHYFAQTLDPLRPEPVTRAGQLEGQLAHCAVLEPDEFAKRYISTPLEAPRRPTEAQWNAKNSTAESERAKAYWREFNERAAGKTIITAAQYETAMRQAQSIRKLPQVAEALARGKPEATTMWIDALTGEPCRCRPDWVADYRARRVVLLDVKTCGDASADEFARQIARKRYHVQDAFYSDGYAAAHGVDVMAFLFVAVESTWPHLANVVQLTENSREQGRRAYRRNLQTYAACRQRGHWPGYIDGDSMPIVTLPAYALDEDLRQRREERDVIYVDEVYEGDDSVDTEND